MEKLTLNNITIILATSTLVLAAAVWHCYKANKPLRIKAREEAEAVAKKKAREVAEGREKDRRTNFRKELYSDLEQLIADPSMLIDHRLGSPFRGTGYRWKNLAEFIQKVRGMQDQEQRIRDLEASLRRNGEIARSNEKLLRDIAKALQLGQPIE